LAGQGVNLGFGDVMKLTDSLKENVNAGAEIGSSVYLEKYESRRQREAFPKVVGVDLLNKLYTDANYPIKFPLVASRTIGLTISNRVVPLKNFFISQAKA
jgi:2-polyprenyl-6-methoxyphenol hydroxylase-like FAD-dependent oxidoreductase